MDEEELPELLEQTGHGERIAAFGSVILVGVVTFFLARYLAQALQKSNHVSLRHLERLAAPFALLVAVGAELLGLLPFVIEREFLVQTLELLLLGGVFWFAARLIDVVWATSRRSHRMRGQTAFTAVLLAARRLGKVMIFAAALAFVGFRLGVMDQLGVAIGAIGAAIAFAARDPISNVFAFVEIVGDPPFRLGDRVRIVDVRGGEECNGRVVRIALTQTSIETRRGTNVVLANNVLLRMRIENLSAAGQHHLELTVPVPADLPSAELRDLCDALEVELSQHEHVSDGHPVTVWISGRAAETSLHAELWVKKVVRRRRAARELTLALRERLVMHTGKSIPPGPPGSGGQPPAPGARH